ncbi:MAG: DUF4388 domain-containing protein [Planctomycetota bacterium]
MSDLSDSLDPLKTAEVAEQVAEVLGLLADSDSDDGAKDFEILLERVGALVQRKVAMRGSKNDTKDLASEIVFSRLRRAFRTFLRSGMGENEVRVAEWALSAIVGGAGLLEFAAAIDSAILKHSGPTDFSFAGRADFIRIEELMQMLASGKHSGCLSLEKRDNRLDIYIDRGRIVFLDPHRITRRVWPGSSMMDYRELPDDKLKIAEERLTHDGSPLLLTLAELGAFGKTDVRDELLKLGTEVLFDFIRSQEEAAFRYVQHEEMPSFLHDYDLKLGITPVLLEVSKNLDEWRGMTTAFPDCDAAIEPLPDMHSRLGDVALGVLEIKLLTLLDGEHSPRDLAELLGLPLFDVYRYLTSFAKAGAVFAPGGVDEVFSVDMSVEESVQSAMTALDENDDDLAVNSALDKVLGGFGEEESESEDGGLFNSRPNLDLLQPSDD